MFSTTKFKIRLPQKCKTIMLRTAFDSPNKSKSGAAFVAIVKVLNQ